MYANLGTMKCLESMVNYCNNWYVEHLEIHMPQMVLRGNTQIADAITIIWIDLLVSLCAQFKNLQGDSKSQELAREQFISHREPTQLLDFTSKVLVVASLALSPWPANHPYCFRGYQCLAAL